ncbi:hypothetical protein [Miniimonas sp. S16]|uniref:hypothetical protein n=1 Tax=Miniimonas sp. S16 TaxID=2171623 RepID=UPI00131EF9BE|nr:hypothetical protein [Miniimonas sp. S16]
MTSSDLLRSAWTATTGNEYLDQLRRRSLSAGASQDPRLAATLRSLETGARTQLDLHIEDSGENLAHETSALALGEFLRRAEGAVRELAKSGSRFVRLHGHLNVLAPSPGSVRIVLLEQPDAAEADEDGRDGSSALWHVGMERLADTFELATAGTDDLDEALSEYSVGAREALRLLGKTVAEQEWSIAGSLVERDGELRPTRLTVQAADRIVDAAQRRPEETRAYDSIGYLDGWRWSNSTLRFAQKDGGAIEVSVGQSMRSDVAALVADRSKASHQFLAKMMVTEAVSRTGGVRTTYRLMSLQQAPDLVDEAE